MSVYDEIANKVAIKNPKGMITNAGKLLLHALAPDDFEYYLMGFELVNSNTNKVEYRFIFPVLPKQFQESDSQNTTIKKTAGGVVAYTNNTFTIKNISISGTFGRKFKILLGTVSDINPVSFLTPKIKTGYGCLQALKQIYKMSTDIAPDGGLYLVKFYNFALNANYYVEILGMDRSMTEDSNMLWDYSMNMKAVAAIEQTYLSEAKDRVVAGVKKLVKNVKEDISNKIYGWQQQRVLNQINNNSTTKSFSLQQALTNMMKN